MITAMETTKLRLIRQMALDGKGHLVSRADKQWVLDSSAREGDKQNPRVLALALAEGYDISENIGI